MIRRSATITLTFMLATFALVGLAPTTTAVEDDCGSACVENCTVGVGTRITATCEIGHQPYTVDTCPMVNDCGETMFTCTALDRPNGPRCDLESRPMPTCVGWDPSDPPQYGICYDLQGEDCMVWYVNDLFYTCIVKRIIR